MPLLFAIFVTPAGGHCMTSRGARHTAGSYAGTGASQKVIATLLSHSDSATTERHVHVVQGETAAMVEARWLRPGFETGLGSLF